MKQELSEMPEVVHASDLVIKLRVNRKMEIVVNLLNLCEVLVLHSATSFALCAVLGGVREQDLVDYNVVDIDLLLCELNSESLRLVHREELWDAHCDKCCLASVFELLIDFLNLCLHAIDSIKHALLDVLRVLTTLSLVHHALHLAEHASEFIL